MKADKKQPAPPTTMDGNLSCANKIPAGMRSMDQAFAQAKGRQEKIAAEYRGNGIMRPWTPLDSKDYDALHEGRRGHYPGAATLKQGQGVVKDK